MRQLKLFHIYMRRLSSWGVAHGRALGGLVDQSDKVNTAVSHYAPFQILFPTVMRSRYPLSPL